MPPLDVTVENAADEQLRQQAQSDHDRRLNETSERNRRAKVDDALRTRPPNHQWAKDLEEAQAHLAEVSEPSRAAAARVASCEREITNAQAEFTQLQERRAELEKERATLDAAVAVGEHTAADAARLAELCELLDTGQQGERFVLVEHGSAKPVEGLTPELKRITDKIAALRERRRAAVSDYIPLYRDRIAADYNVKSLVTANLQDKLARLQAEVAKAEADLVDVNRRTVHAQSLRPGADPETIGNRGIVQHALEEVASNGN